MKRSLTAAFVLMLVSVFAWGQSAADTAELTRILNEFLDGAGRNDAAVHDKFWAEDLIYTRGAGQRVGKTEIMKSVRESPPAKPDDPKTVFTAEDVRIQQYANTAVVAFRLIRTTTSAGKVTVSKNLNTGTFVKRKGKWQVVAWQSTRMPTPAEDARKQVAEIESAYHKAMLASDIKAMSAIIDRSYIWTHTTGERVGRDQLLDDLKTGKLKYVKLETKDVVVTTYGDSAIVRGVSDRQRAPNPQTGAEQKPFTIFYTITLINFGGTWRIVAFHTSHT